jgi:hypothetical protein
MRTDLNYSPCLGGLDVIKNEKEQFDEFFYSGHPYFLIPDFNRNKDDIWLSFMDYYEKEKNIDLYDQNGGEIIEHKVIDSVSGLTECKYQSYGFIEDKDSDEFDCLLTIQGYVIKDEENGNYFLATSVKIQENYQE